MGTFDASLITVPTIENDAGALGVLEDSALLGFEIARAYFIYDVPGGSERGGHAHKELSQVLVAVRGSLTVRVSDDVQSKAFFLNSPRVGLRLSPGLWRDMYDFSADCVCLVLASEKYRESDYLRDHSAYLDWLSNK